MAEQDSVVAGRSLRPLQDDDLIQGAVIKPARGTPQTSTTTGGGGARVAKNKSRRKGTSSQRTAPADVVTSSADKERSQSNPASRQELINRIKAMPDEMLAGFIKPYVELMVDKFKINTREKVANFFGQIAAESSRGNAEYVYYTNGDSFKKAFGGRVKSTHLNDLVYKNPSTSRPYGFSPKKAPWEVGGWPDLYYGGLNGNTRGKISSATNDQKNIGPTQEIPSFRLNPGFYKGSPEGYAYRGHGVIQITGKVQYERMNEYFGRNGKYEKNDIDFLQNPEIASYNWKSNLGVPNKFAFLSALMWWENHKGVYINKVSLPTTRTITESVKGRDTGFQDRHKNVERYFYFLLYGSKPAKQTTQGTYSIVDSANLIKVVKPSQLRFLSIIPSVTPSVYQSRFGINTFANLSYFESNGTPTPPYKDKTTDILKRLPGQKYPVFGIDKNNVARIYDSDDIFLIWNSLVYACAGFPRLIKNGKSAYNDPGAKYSFNRLTGRTAIGIKPSGELVIYVAKSKYISNVITELLAMGCTDAINFDGGTSTFVIENNKALVSYGISSGRRFPSVMTWT